METIVLLQANAEIVLPQDGLVQKLRQAQTENRKLIIKLGFDPTAPDLHLGHAVVLRKLRQFQDLGHQIVIIVGSFTARIGDPTGKSKSRPPLSPEQVMTNADTYIRQLSKIIDVDRCQIRFNSDWLDALGSAELIQLLAKVTVAQLMHRHDFSKRFAENTPIAMHELMYPILQGFDSVQIGADVEMGGTDQLFNCTMGRQLQEAHGLDPQIVLCMPLLRGLDGKEKMSKSLNNTIGLTDSPEDMFGKVMSIPDELIPEFLELTTDFTPEVQRNLKAGLAFGDNPMNLKKAIARNIIRQYHNEACAEAAEQFFVNQFQNRVFDEKTFEAIRIDSLHLEAEAVPLIDLCHRLKPQETRSALRRLIVSGAVQINTQKQVDPHQLIQLEEGLRIKMGKRNFIQLVS